MQLADLLFAWRVAKFVKSNAIVFGRAADARRRRRADEPRRFRAHRCDQGGERRLALALGRRVRRFFPFRDGLDVVVDAARARSSSRAAACATTK